MTNSKLIKALEDFKNAYTNLELQWSNHIGLADGSQGYPFDKSFDEIDVPGWVASFQENLKNEKKPKIDLVFSVEE